MPEFTEVTADNLRFVRGAHGLTQEAIAELLGIPFNAVSKIESGARALAEAEKKLLDLYFFGKMPEGMVRRSADLSETLDFTEQEWRMINVIANRVGQPVDIWIRDNILEYLAFLEGRANREEDGGEDGGSNSGGVLPFKPAPPPLGKAAEEPSKYDKSNAPSADGKTSARGSAQPPPKGESQKETA